MSPLILDRNLDRRKLIATMGSLAGTAALAPLSGALAQGAAGTVKLRLLETTDIHVNLLPYDYYRDAPDDTVGLSKLATLITMARSGARNSLLFDNGDFLQGSPMGELIALERGLKNGEVHPVMAAMNLLGYDAATLGNHEFNYGLDFLDKSITPANFPICCANLVKGALRANPRLDATYLKPYLILEREVTDEAGNAHKLKLGIIGVVPPQIMQWDDAHLRGKVDTRDIVETSSAYLPEIREQGVDLVIALAHTGISTASPGEKDENAAFHLSRLTGIDVIFTGHAHRVFPGPGYVTGEGVDQQKGMLNGVPAVMAGFWGSHLGQIDLVLQKDGGRFHVLSSEVAALPIYKRDGGKIQSLVEPAPIFATKLAKDHDATLSYVRKPVGKTALRLESYFSLITDSALTQLISDAQIWYAKPLLASTPHAGLPLLSAVAPFKAGGRGGPSAYTDVAAGDIALKNAADIYVFPNTLKVVRISGAQLADWLERSAGIFNQIKATEEEQSLVRLDFPPYNFDMIHGVTYAIDLSQPSKFDVDGKPQNAGARRIVDLAYGGKPVQKDDVFAVVTNNYRAGGGGNFAGLDSKAIILDAPDYSRDIIAHYLAAAGAVSPKPDRNWHLLPITGARKIVLLTNPAAKEVAASVPGVSFAGDGGDGFAKFTVTLGG
ncbi:2',3'-cyclic-nucleotide 2'-phosphodiesterase / 3'-nucleotidase [Rhizobiales bacterium GAS113]|nr:2',3'-cyclic-nucleotide 2'-phosphodiesterase / 3'-nucleotidase [Rhizobiales bacterium GAS113]